MPIGRHPNEERVALLQAESYAQRDELGVRRRLYRKAVERLDLKLLEPFRAAHRRLRPAERAQLIARIVAYLAG